MSKNSDIKNKATENSSLSSQPEFDQTSDLTENEETELLIEPLDLAESQPESENFQSKELTLESDSWETSDSNPIINENPPISDSFDNSFPSAEETITGPADIEPLGDEHTENLSEIIPSGSNRKKYLIPGVIFGGITLVLVAFFVLNQVQASQISKALELGENYLEEGKYEEAILAFDKVLEIDEKQVPAYEGKGASYLGMDNYTQAEAELETAKSIEFTDTGKLLMADVYVKTDRKDQGIKLAEEVAASNPADPEMTIQLGNFYTQIEEFNKVIDLLEKQIAETEDKDQLKKLYDQLIPAFVKSGKTEAEIQDLLKRAAEATGDNSYLEQEETYIVNTPSFSLASGEYSGAQSLEIIRGNAADTLYYTIDGSIPTTASLEYTGPITLDIGTITVKVLEVNASDFSALPVEAAYVIKEAALTESEFINALYGGWYEENGRTVMSFGYNKFSIGSAGTDNSLYGSYEVESTTENGGVIIVYGTTFDNEVTGDSSVHTYRFNFDFGDKGDNRIDLCSSDGSWSTFLLGKALSGNKYYLPTNGGLELTIN